MVLLSLMLGLIGILALAFILITVFGLFAHAVDVAKAANNLASERKSERE